MGQGHFILDLGDEFRWFQPSKTKIADAWNGAFSWMHKMSKFRMKQPCYMGTSNNHLIKVL